MKEKTAALLIGFGGPQGMAEVRPFLESVLEGVRIPPQRFEEVLHHYEAFGGVSAYNAVTYRQQKALERWLNSQNSPLPVAVGFRHCPPSFREVFRAFKKEGVKKVVGFVLASFRSFASFEKYQAKILDGRREAGAENIEIVYTDSFAANTLYLEAQADEVKKTLRSFSEAEKHTTYFLFSAHSIPVVVSEQSISSHGASYASQFLAAGASIAGMLGLNDHWSVAYQSRSGNPHDPWLEPDVKDVVARLDTKKFERVLFIPVGFLCDNVEVVYDLDTEAKKSCEEHGFGYFRASTVADHPKFIEMMGRQILEKL